MGRPQAFHLQTNFGRDIDSSADLCYNGTNGKPSSERKVARCIRDGTNLVVRIAEAEME